MAQVTMLRRSGTKPYPHTFQEGTDDAVLDSIQRSSSGTANLWDDANVTSITVGGGAANTSITMMGGASTGTVALGNSAAGAVTVDSGAGVSVDAGAASNFTTSAGALTLTSAAAATWSTAAGGLILNGAGGVQLQGNAGEIDLTTSGALDLNSGAYTLNCSTAVVTPTSTYDLEATGAIGIDSSGAINIGDTNATAVNIGRTGVTVTIPGDLVVDGTTTAIDSEVVNIADNHLYLNKDYATVAAQTGGLVVNYLPTATASTTDTGGFATTTTVNVGDGTALAAGDFIQVSGAADPTNDGLYEVLSVAAGGDPDIITIDASPTHDFVQTAFTVDATDTTATITKVNVSVIRAGTDGIWETGAGSTSGALTFTDLATAGGASLQSAYVAGNTITMTDAEGNFDVSVTSGTPAISLDAAGASNFTVASANLSLGTTTAGDVLISTTTAGEIDLTSAGLMDLNAGASLDIDVTGTFDVLATGAFSIDGTGASNVTADSGNLSLSSTTSGSVLVDAVGSVEINSSGGTIDIGNDAVAQNINIGTGAAARIIGIGNGTGATSIVINAGTGNIDIGTGAQARTTQIATGAAVQTVTVGSTNTTSSLTLQSGTGAMTFTAGGVFDVNATGAVTIDGTGVSIDGSAASNFTVTGTGDLTMGSTLGSAILESGEAVTDAVTLRATHANGGITMTAGSPGYAIGSLDAAVQTNDLFSGGTGAKTNVIGSTASTSSMTLQSGSGSMVFTAGGIFDVNATGEVTVDGSAGISLDAATASNFTVSGASADLTLGARSTTITLNETGNTSLTGFTATSIVGALNELKATGGGSALETSYTAGAGGIAVSDAVYISATNTVLKADASTDTIASRFLGIAEAPITAAAAGQIITEGPATARFDNGLTLVGGEEVFLSETSGNLTNVEPTTSGAVVQIVGYIKDGTGYVTVTNPFAVIHLIRGARLVV